MKSTTKKIISITLSLLLVLSVFSAAAAEDDLLRHGEKITFNGHTYIRVDTSMTWQEAKEYCESQGGYLATVTSLAERTAVERLILNGNKEQYWLGATDEEKEGTWKWVTGEEWTDFIPMSNFDNAYGIEDYLQIQRVNSDLSGDGTGKFNDAPVDNYLKKESDFYSLSHVGFIFEQGEYEKDKYSYTVDGLTATFNGHTYTLVEQSLTWDEAAAACKEMGGYLATVTSEKENEVIEALIANGTQKAAYWLGGTDGDTEGTWKWITGEAWTYTSDNYGFDNSYGNEDYLQIQRKTIENHAFGFWNDAPVDNYVSKLSSYYNSQNVGYILEIGETDTIVNGLTASYKGHTYTLVEQSLTWDEAAAACEEQGGYLATVTSEEENNVIKALISNGTQKSMYWLGATDRNNEGDWQWVNGETWSYVPDYMKFDNSRGNEDYLQIQRIAEETPTLGFWNDIAADNYCSKSQLSYYNLGNVGYILETGDGYLETDASSSSEDAPIIYVKGRSNIYNASGKRLAVENTEDIPDVIWQLKEELIDAILHDTWDVYREKLVEKIDAKFGDHCLNNDGEVDNGSHVKFTWDYQSVSDVQQDMYSYMFEYDCRLDPWDIAEDLHAYISCVKAKTGSSKIHFVSRCLGCNIVSAYIARYGYDDVLSNVFFASAAKGFDYESEMFAGKYDFDGPSLARYTENDLDLAGESYYITEFLKATILLCNDMKILDLSTGMGTLVFNQIKDEITPVLLLHTFATCPGYWGMVNDENFEAAKEFIFGDEANTTYKNLVAKIDRYHYNAMNKLDDNLVNMKNSGINMYILCKYGFQCSPFIESSNKLSDNTVDVYSQSFGATCADMGKTLSTLYLLKARRSSTYKYISPDKQIDSSTALFKDSTWYVKNLEHSPFYDCFNPLLQKLSYSEEQVTAFDDSSYPQYLFYNDSNSTCVPLDNSNKTFNDYLGESFFIYLHNYYKALFRLIERLVKD